METGQEIRKRLTADAAAWGIALTGEQADRFADYARLLLDWNERINLTRITEPTAICRQHFLDSIAPMRFVSFESCSLIDIGTGAGFPGIPLRIMNPSLELTLLDALDKRCRFLEEVVRVLGLNDAAGRGAEDKPVTVLHGRAEDFAAARAADSLRGCFDFAASRAVAKLNILCEYAVPFLKIGGRFIAYKLDDGGAELGGAADAMRQLGASFDRCETYMLPETAPARALCFLAKAAETPEKYPRRAGMPEKRPL